MRVGCSHGGQYVKDDYSGEFTKPNKELDLEDLFNRPGASGFQERGRERERATKVGGKAQGDRE